MRYTLSVTSAVLLAAVSSTAARAQGEVPSLEVIIEAVSRHPQQLGSASVEGVEHVQRTPDFSRLYKISPNAIPEPPQQAFTWAFKDEKRFRSFVVPGQYYRGSRPVQPGQKALISRTETEAYDGKKEYRLLTSRYEGLAQEIIEGHMEGKRTSKVSPSSFGYQLADKWLGEVLSDGSHKVDGTTNDPRWGSLVRLSGERSTPYGKVTTRFWIAPALATSTSAARSNRNKRLRASRCTP